MPPPSFLEELLPLYAAYSAEEKQVLFHFQNLDVEWYLKYPLW